MTDDASYPAVVIERSFDAPVDLVWRMWTEPEHFKSWHGPNGARIPVAKLDESMSDESGHALSPSDVGMSEDHPAATEVTVEFEQTGSGTTVVLTHAGIPADSPGAAGWLMALDKLATHVAAHSLR